MTGVQGLKFAILPNGWIERDKAIDLRLNRMAVTSNPAPRAEWWRIPVFSVLISHPEAGYILLDGGARRGSEYGGGARQSELEEKMPLYVEDGQWLSQQLAALGIAAEDLSKAVLSNFHWHTVGALDILPGTEAAKQVYVPKADFAYGAVMTHLEKKDYGYFYMYRDFAVQGMTYTYIDTPTTLAQGVTLLPVRGYAPATLMVLLELESGAYLFTGEALPSHKNAEGICSSLAYDSQSFFASLQYLKSLEEKYHATLIYPHDPAQYDGLLKAPHWYE